MGRVKIAPTPRNTALNDAMRRAAANITSSSSLRPADLARSLPLPEFPPRLPIASTRPSAPVSRTSKASTKDRSSVESQKRKADLTDDPAPPAKKAATSKLALRSNAKPSPPTNSDAATKAKSTTPMEPTRRSTRSSKVAAPVESTPPKKPACRASTKSPRPIRVLKKPGKAAPVTAPLNEEQQKAIVMLQGEEIFDDDDDDDDDSGTYESSAAGRSTHGSVHSKASRRGSAAVSATTADDTKSDKNYDVLPPQVSANETPGPFETIELLADTPFESTGLLPHDNDDFKLNHLTGLPFSVPATPVLYLPEPQLSVTSVYPDPINVAPGYPDMQVTVAPNAPFEKPPVDDSSATSGDSGYATSQHQQPPMFMNGAGLLTEDDGYPVAPVTPRPQSYQFVVSTKGQKVKGRPTPKNPKTREVTPRSGRNVANTYPRKQPFKAQIEFTNYPPAGADIPADFTLWEICQNYPNSLRESTLIAFVQREWSANELCACLKDDARETLNSRPGKDKTMVYQKRMERIKKDLVAKGDYERLLHGPMIREDGRPTWVKRGNVRRK